MVGGFDPERARDAARRLRDGGAEVILLGREVDATALGRAAIAEDASEVVVGSRTEAAHVHGWLNEHGASHVTVHTASE